MADESAELTLNNNNKFQLVQPFRTENVSTNTSTQSLDVKPLSLEVKPLSQTSNQTLDLRPVNVDSRQELAVPDPIRTDATSVLDLRPIALDVCMRTGQASLPPTHVCEPYNHRLAFTLLGIEVFGVAWSGESQTIVEDRPGRPMVAWGDVTPAPPTVHVRLPQHGPAPPKAHGHDDHGRHRPDGGSGLRIRLAD